MKKLFVLVGAILLTGVWLGINLAKDQPLFSNPFAERDIRDKAQRMAEELYKDSKEALIQKLKDE